MKKKYQSIDAIKLLDQLQNNTTYPLVKKLFQEPLDPPELTRVMEWSEQASLALSRIRYETILMDEDIEALIFMKIKEIVENLAKASNYFYNLGYPAHEKMDAVLSEAYWHLMGEDCDVEHAHHHFHRSNQAIDSVVKELPDEGPHISALIAAERHLDGVGVDKNRDESKKLAYSVIDDCEDIGLEGWRLLAKLELIDDVDRELNDLWEIGYIAAWRPSRERLDDEEHDDVDREERDISDTDTTSLVDQLDAELEKLNNMVGLADVKAQVQRLVADEKVQAMRRERGLGGSSTASRHMVLTGNPGTGKTTVARILSRIFYLMGAIKKDVFVETDRSGLVGKYIGETAQKTKAVIQSAIGGVLFIDEAYALSAKSSSNDSYGEEAINILLKEMEDHRSDLIVIVAGYTSEMEHFLASNPGLRSRFTSTLHFSDYSPSDMTTIFKDMVKKDELKIGKASISMLEGTFQQLSTTRDAKGNGRFVRNFYENCRTNLSRRIAALNDAGHAISDDELITIEGDDIAAAARSLGADPSSPGHQAKVASRVESRTSRELKEIHPVNISIYKLEKMK